MLHRIARKGSGSRLRSRSAVAPGPATTIAFLALLIASLLGLSVGAIGCNSAKVSSATATVTDESSQTTTSTVIETTTTTVVASSTTESLEPLPTTSSSTTSTSSTTTTTSEELSSAETRLANGRIRAMGYIDKVWESGGVRYIRIDYAEMLTGEEAKAAAIEAGELSPGEDLPNDYYIRNTNPQKREFSVASSATITTSTFVGAGMDHPITWEEFQSFWSDSPPEGGEHLHEVLWRIERDGPVVVSIAEQYLP